MTKSLKWRLGKLPSPDEVLKLLNEKLITKEEARDILFNETETAERDVESYQQEIKFLREIIDKLSNKTHVIETIRYVQPSYSTYTWTTPYTVYCGGGGGGGSGAASYITDTPPINGTANGTSNVYLSGTNAAGDSTWSQTTLATNISEVQTW